MFFFLVRNKKLLPSFFFDFLSLSTLSPLSLSTLPPLSNGPKNPF